MMAFSKVSAPDKSGTLQQNYTSANIWTGKIGAEGLKMDIKLNIQGKNGGCGIKVEQRIYKIKNIVQNPQRKNKTD